METEKIQKVRQILAEHLKDNKNILILGEDYLTGKTILLNKIMENLENKEKILFISRMDELHKKNKGINHIIVNGDKYAEIDYEENFIIDEKGKILIPPELANVIVQFKNGT